MSRQDKNYDPHKHMELYFHYCLLDFFDYSLYNDFQKEAVVMKTVNSYFQFEVADREQARIHRIHYHAGYEVYYLCDGICRYFIENKTYSLTSGDILERSVLCQSTKLIQRILTQKQMTIF